MDTIETLILGTLHTRSKNIVARAFQTALLENITLTEVGDNIYHIQGYINPVGKDDPMFKRLEHAVRTIISEQAVLYFSNANYQWQQAYKPKRIKLEHHLNNAGTCEYNA